MRWSSSRPPTTRSATTRGSGRSSTTCSPASPAGPRALYRADRLAEGVAREAVAPPGRERQARAAGDPRALPAVPQARGPRPHRRPQDQQRAGPGAAHPSAGQDPGDRRDGRRPARRRDRHGVRAARPAVRRVHGRGGHPPPGARTCFGCTRWAPRSAASPAARRRSRTRSTRRCATGSPTSRPRTTSWARRWARTRTPRSSATSSAGSATRRRRSWPRSRDGCPTSRSRASAAARTRSACWRGSSASRRSVWRWPRRPATGSRPVATRRRSRAARRGSSTAAGR